MGRKDLPEVEEYRPIEEDTIKENVHIQHSNSCSERSLVGCS